MHGEHYRQHGADHRRATVDGPGPGDEPRGAAVERAQAEGKRHSHRHRQRRDQRHCNGCAPRASDAGEVLEDRRQECSIGDADRDEMHRS